MSADFRSEPFRVIYEQVTDIEADVLAEQQQLVQLRKANTALLKRVRALQDLIRPTLGDA